MSKPIAFADPETQPVGVMLLAGAMMLLQIGWILAWVALWMNVESGYLNRDAWMQQIAGLWASVSQVAMLQGIVGLVLLLALAHWLYTMNRNIRVLGYEPRLTPLLAALGLFLPGINLVWLPYTLLEIWWGSDPGRLPESTQPKTFPLSIVVWFVLLVVAGVSGMFVPALGPKLEAIEAFKSQAVWGLVSMGASLAMLGMLIMVVREISVLQVKRHQIMFGTPPVEAQEVVTATE